MKRADQVIEWRLDARSVTFCLLLPRPNPDDALGEYMLRSPSPNSPTLTACVPTVSGPWRGYEFTYRDSELCGRVLVYRRRAIVELQLPKGLRDLDTAIRWVVSEQVQIDIATIVRTVTAVDRVPSRMMPLMIADLRLKHRRRQDWMSDGTTSFYFRLYDSVSRHQAIVRTSRHLVILAGASARLRQEILNLIFERILYSKSGMQVSDEDVFAFLEGLANYTVPTETSIFLQREFANLGIWLALVQVVNATALGALQIGYPIKAVPIAALVVGVLVTLVISYFFIRRLALVRWD